MSWPKSLEVAFDRLEQEIANVAAMPWETDYPYVSFTMRNKKLHLYVSVLEDDFGNKCPYAQYLSWDQFSEWAVDQNDKAKLRLMIRSMDELTGRLKSKMNHLE